MKYKFHSFPNHTLIGKFSTIPLSILVFASMQFIHCDLSAQPAAWLSEIQSPDDFTILSIPDTSRSDLLRTSKFLAPAKVDPNLQPTVFQNVNQYLLHLEFMAQEFPDRFGGLTMEEYTNLVMVPGQRAYFAGTLYQFRDSQGSVQYGFDFFSTPTQPLDPAEVSTLYALLSQSMKLRPFAYSPINPSDIEQAKRWEDPGFPIYLPEGITEPEYEAYSPGVNYGRVRRFTLLQLAGAEKEGKIGWQDIVIVDTAPTDITTVVAGIVTGSRQGELSHVNVRSLRRGTPNAYIQNPLEVFSPYGGSSSNLV